VLALTTAGSPASISEVLTADLAARELAREQIKPQKLPQQILSS
jgi:hypothetical protein